MADNQFIQVNSPNGITTLIGIEKIVSYHLIPPNDPMPLTLEIKTIGGSVKITGALAGLVEDYLRQALNIASVIP